MKVKITTQSIGTINGVLHVGSTADVEDNIAESWVNAGFAQYVVEEKTVKKSSKKQSEPSQPTENKVDEPTETKTEQKEEAAKATIDEDTAE